MVYRGHALPGEVRTLPGEYYTSAAIHREEAVRIFAQRWVCVGRAAGVPEAGDFIRAEVAGESLVVVRGADGAVRAFYNVCRHRGTRLCEEPAGRFPGSIQCPYHAWTYGLEGELLGAPHMTEEWFDKADFPLHAAALAEWEGFLFVSLAERPVPLAEVLSPLAGKFTAWRLPELRARRRIEYDVRANWKLFFQNFSECYHCPRIHPELTRLSHYRSGANDLVEGPILGGYMRIDREGGSLTLSGAAAGPRPLAGIGEEDLSRVYYYSVFPSLFVTLLPDYALWHTLEPRGVDRTRVVCEWLFAADAPEEGAQDAVAFWDLTNQQDWHVCELAQQGVSSRAYTPGPYATQESLLAAFDRELLAALGRTDARGTP
jgi:glycine betaine catabolism A